VTQPVALVVDTGVDDALALVVAARHPRLDLRGVVCTAGNVQLSRVLANTRFVLDLLGADVPVAVGAEDRSDGTPFPERDVHGVDGLAGLAVGASPVLGQLPTPAEVVTTGTVVVSLGPLTAVRGLAAARVVASYARPGEANHAMDPAAAAGVRYEPVDVPPHPLDEAAVRGPRTGGAPGRRLAAALLAYQRDRRAGLGDAAVMLMLAEPELEPARWARRVIELASAEH
jgi:Inosine-uridine preferring nucleoside hydrolase